MNMILNASEQALVQAKTLERPACSDEQENANAVCHKREQVGALLGVVSSPCARLLAGCKRARAKPARPWLAPVSARPASGQRSRRQRRRSNHNQPATVTSMGQLLVIVSVLVAVDVTAVGAHRSSLSLSLSVASTRYLAADSLGRSKISERKNDCAPTRSFSHLDSFPLRP